MLDYLGRYTHRVAISNHRLLASEDGGVRFQWRNYRHHSQRKTITLPAEEFHPPLPPARAAVPVPEDPLF